MGLWVTKSSKHYREEEYCEEGPTIRVVQTGLRLQLLQETFRSPQSLRSRQGLTQIVHQPVEAGVVRRFLEVFGTLVQPSSQERGQGTETTQGKSDFSYGIP